MSNWIKGAIKHPGAFSAKAKAAGMSTAAYAKAKSSAPGTLGKQARLADTLMHLHGSGKSSPHTPGDTRTKGQKLYQLG